jgi:NAD/NADP transhydrogenase beta subunit
MLYITIALFALAAIVGFIILKNWLTSAETSRTTVYLHGIFAALALVLLVVYAFQNPTNYPKASIVLFVIGALIGFYMFAEDLKKKFSPTWLAVVHALFGVAGFLLLLFFVFG